MKIRLPGRPGLSQRSGAVWTGGEGVSRRSLLQSALGSAGLLAGGGCLLGACSEDGPRPPQVPPLTLRYRGINYDVGTDSELAGAHSVRDTESIRRDIRAVRSDLHCDAVGIHGTDLARLTETSAYARERGLEVWLQPRRFDVPADALLAHLDSVAQEAERLRRQYGNVVLNVGVEMTLLNTGFIPGATILERIAGFPTLSPSDWQRMTIQLNDVLTRAVRLARDRFQGPLTYGAGPWEWDGIDWSGFDIIGLDHYLDRDNRADYAEPLRQFRSSGKPVVVLEFGCCTYEGAQDAGGMGWAILDQDAGRLDGAYVRSEETQADYINQLLDIFQAEKVTGAFLYQFVEPTLVHHPTDPRRDLDMASYSVVKVLAHDEGTGAYQWQPKLAFQELARRYRAR
jgi:hypothetical protein